MTKICIISPSLKLGGIERALTTLAIEFDSLGHEIHFITCLKSVHFYELPKSILLYEPTFKRTNSKINKFLFYPRLLKFLRSSVQQIKPDRVLVFGDWFSPITLLALYGTSFQIFISDRTIPNYKFKFPIPFLKHWLYPRSKGFIAQTTRAKDFKTKQFGSRLNIKVIPNALPDLGQNNEIEEIKRNEDILYVGRFAWEKDPEILIRAISYIKEKKPQIILKMAGDGPLLPQMKSLVWELGIQKNVLFLGPVKNVEELYRTSNLLVLPSVVEGFPNTLIEAMSFGLPTICFSDIPYEDIIQNRKNGLVVHERSTHALIEVLIDILNNDEIKGKIQYNSTKSVSQFAKNRIAKQILDFMSL